MPENLDHIYKKISSELQEMIHLKILSAGEKLPSIRKMSQIKGVSTTTVILAYLDLERKELIHAKPNSGFYVRSLLKSTQIESRSTTHMKPLRVKPEALNEINCLMKKLPSKYPNLISTVFQPPGYPKLLQDIAKMYRYINLPIAPDDIFITSGYVNSVFLSLSVMTKPGETIAIQSTRNFEFLHITKILHLKAIALSTHPSDGIDIQDVKEKILNEKIKLCLFEPNFCDSMGSLLSDTHKEKLTSLLESYNIPIVEVDTCGDIFFTERRPKTLKHFDKNDNVTLCSSFELSISNKIRVGWICSKRIRKKLIEYQLASSPGDNALFQLFMSDFLTNRRNKKHLASLRKKVQSARDQTIEIITQHFPVGTIIHSTQMDEFIWIELPGSVDTEKLDLEGLGNGIAILPWNRFSTDKKPSNCIRVSYLERSTELQKDLVFLGSFLKNMIS